MRFSVLVADDEKMPREILRDRLPWEELRVDRVDAAEDGAQALEMARAHRPDIIISDVKMPRMNGLELAGAVREMYPDCQFIFLSGYTDKEYLKGAIKLRAASYVEKPIDLEEIAAVLRQVTAELEQRAYLRIAATYTTNQYILPPVYKRFLALRLPVSLWIHTLRDVDITQALLSHELDFAFIDSNTVFDDRLTVRPAFREPFLLLSPPDSHYPEEVDPASLDVAEELLVTWDPEFIRWHDRWFGTGARPLLYADTLQAADFLPPAEGRWVAAPAIAAASRIGNSARVCHFTSPPPDRVNYLVTRAGEPLTPPALRFLQELKGHLLAQDNVQVYL